MRKIIICLCIIIFFATSITFAQEVGEKVYKDVVIDGEKVNKWLNVEEICLYDAKENIFYAKDYDGTEWWYDYEARGKLTHIKNSDGTEWWLDYDNKGNEIHGKSSDGTEWWFDYDTKGNKIHEKGSTGKNIIDYWYYYDWEKGKKIKRLKCISF